MIIIYSVIGGLLGYFIIHPLFMIIGHTMLESNFIHDHHVLDIIKTEYFDSFSIKMLPWSLTFTFVSALVMASIGYIIHLQKKLRNLSYIDGLTSISNRRHFEERIEHMYKHCARSSKPLSLIMCDIDYFKDYNDAYGHQNGDKCLKLLAKALSDSIKRPLDMVARYGGEEFVIILPDTTLDNTAHIAERIHEKVASLNIVHSESKVAKLVTLSLGVATTVPTQNSNYDALILAADTALYRAKKEGRNKSVIS